MPFALLLTALLASAPTPHLTLAPAAPVPGGLLIVEAWGVDDPASLSGEIEGQSLRFFTAGAHHQRALVGLRLSRKPGPLEARVTWRHAGAKETLRARAKIAFKAFQKKELRVAGKFVSPPASTRAQRRADSRAIAQAYAEPFGPARFSGSLANPKPGAPITAHFGDQRVFNGKKQSEHHGTDFDGEIGDPILAAAEGKVVLARGCYMSGNTVIVSHGGGLFTSYFHMSRMDVAVGETVHRAQQLGLVGMTGRATGPHLHFGVKVFKRLVDAQESFKLDTGLDEATASKN